MNRQPWWFEPKRLLQMNLREIDGNLDPDAYVRQVLRMHANVVLFNVGGIVANYPTDLPFHFRNPFLRGDLVGDVLERAHAHDIRVVARFDFSKVNRSVADSHPDWLYNSRDAHIVEFNGQVHTCPSAPYQQEASFSILGEVLGRYEIDGLFFNMPGYHTWDYSMKDHGPCRCRACLEGFRAESGFDVPRRLEDGHAVTGAYRDFTKDASSALFRRIRDFAKSRRPGIAVATYTTEAVDIVIEESNSDPDRSLPEWTYSATDHVLRVQGSWRGKVSCNLAMNFVGLGQRHVAVPARLTELRITQNLVHGAWPTFVVIGQLDDQADRGAIARVEKLFAFHERHETLLGHTRSAAGVALVYPGASEGHEGLGEYRGLLRLLGEHHMPFDVVTDDRLSADDLPRPLTDFDAVILPGVRRLSDDALRVLDNYVSDGGRLLATGAPGIEDEHGNPRPDLGLRCAGVTYTGESFPQEKGCFVRIHEDDKDRLDRDTLRDVDLVYLYGPFHHCEPRDSSTIPLLRFVGPSMYGSPEKCYIDTDTEIPAAFLCRHGSGSAMLIPWGLGAHYEARSHHGHSRLFAACLLGALGARTRIEIDAGPCVEVCHRIANDGSFEMVGLINHTGQLGTAFHDPIPLAGTELRIRPYRPVATARALVAGTPIPLSPAPDDALRLTIPEWISFEIIVLEYEGFVLSSGL